MTGRIRRPIRRPGTARVRLYCLAHAGGDARMFAPWSARLPEHIEVCPVQLPGRGERLQHRPLSTLPEVLDEILAAVDTSLPFALFGHSLGAILAFEAADRLRDHPPARLLVSGHRAPHLPLREEVIHHLPDEQFVARLAELNGTPQVVLDNPGFLRMLLPVMRADFTISETYRYRDRPPLSCPITAFGGTEDPDVSHRELVEWSRHTTGACRAEQFPGDHFFLTRDPDPLLASVARELAEFAPTSVG
ncbi:medium-chain acyl-[acyl-carrier-protein] hydrolase [Streptoalloteichus tenebrarius]|uniref:Medium-chain acyl-[acyl-carrier-protein] hydrolase n=1 Tax=Streptoalloteichus tenebrarius (strain ATCC 17920 / DSM 40477 / JCM 4838 / CBS 697.72 / NBRC 16177 / NCIMB 11028 / NRRL B-12390 / A12253. 1 / ISP 5477) TaxID=1933 RepID=A0ABT1HLG2_STRSD|nr:alpha/beta fold hydrolase [Streptoalloteichus tenebrarius]MCP2256361.1 medium-chain acyl-[acyl-carrier-protein] hydrolase [Streptoalloteichus tenebrarius]BFF04701.1 alpha/beta fold hydrolase [Streptoalloteichus tenebrarius]